MDWQVKIEGKPKQRILVIFNPQTELIIFKGQFSIKNKWVDFSNDTHPMDITLENIQAKLIIVYEKMNERLKVYEDLKESFSIIRNIEMIGGE